MSVAIPIRFRHLAWFLCWFVWTLPWVRAADPPPPRSQAEIEAVLSQAPAQPAEETLRPIRVVLVADVADHGPGAHDYPIWQQRWAALLGGSDGEDGLPLSPGAAGLTVETAWKWPSEEQFQQADLLAFFCYRSGGERRTWNEERLQKLEHYLRQGGGVVVIHSATYTGRLLADEEEAARVAAVTGLVYARSIRYRHGPVELRVTAPEHPICRGLPPRIAFLDEPYWPPHGDLTQVDVLATSEEADAEDSSRRAEQPLFWTYQPGEGRVFGCVMGHYNWTFDDAYFRIFLLRGMAWAAGESPYRFDHLVLAGLEEGASAD